MPGAEYENAKQIYKITEENLTLLKDESRLLHPLPHVEEIELPLEIEQTDDKVAYFRQAENGLYVRMALLSYLLLPLYLSTTYGIGFSKPKATKLLKKDKLKVFGGTYHVVSEDKNFFSDFSFVFYFFISKIAY